MLKQLLIDKQFDRNFNNNNDNDNSGDINDNDNDNDNDSKTLFTEGELHYYRLSGSLHDGPQKINK